MATTLAKQRKTAKKPPATKLCLHCNQVRNLSEFYSNRDWLAQAGKDIWCKKCVSQIQTKDEMREYFFENHRKWDEKIWENARKKAQHVAAQNEKFMRLSDDMRESFLEKMTCEQVPPVMQLHYEYIDNSQDININTYKEAKEAGHVVEEESKAKDANVKTYNAFFNGDFKPAELEYLQNYYDELDEQFDLTDIAMRDNAKKLAKASLTADKVQNDYMAGRCSMQDVTNANAFYNSLMTMGNFAANKRKPGDKAGLSSWAETTAYCETHGHPCIKKIEWEKDVVDTALEGLGYIIESMRDEEMGEVN